MIDPIEAERRQEELRVQRATLEELRNLKEHILDLKELVKKINKKPIA